MVTAGPVLGLVTARVMLHLRNTAGDAGRSDRQTRRALSLLGSGEWMERSSCCGSWPASSAPVSRVGEEHGRRAACGAPRDPRPGVALVYGAA